MNESRQTVETDTLWLSNIRALNFRKPGHLRKYCNNENFPICGNHVIDPHPFSVSSALKCAPRPLRFIKNSVKRRSRKHAGGGLGSMWVVMLN